MGNRQIYTECPVEKVSSYAGFTDDATYDRPVTETFHTYKVVNDGKCRSPNLDDKVGIGKITTSYSRGFFNNRFKFGVIHVNKNEQLN